MSAPARGSVSDGAAMVVCAGDCVGVSRQLTRVVMETGYLGNVDVRVGKPCGDALGKHINVGEYLVEAEACGGADVLEGVADENNAGLRVSLGAVKIDAAAVDPAGDAVFADHFRKFGEAALQQQSRLLEEFAHPWIADGAEGKKGSHAWPVEF